MDESDRFEHVSEDEKIRALKLVVRADGYLSQSQLLKSLNLYKASAEILPDPAIIRKIKKLRKYMKRNGMDLGENKENEREHHSIEKPASTDTPPTPLSANKTLRERTNFGIGSDKDSPKSSEIIPDKSPVISKQESEDPVPEKSEDPVPEKRWVLVPETKDLKTAFANSGPLTLVTDENEENDLLRKRDVQHHKPRLSTSKKAETIPQKSDEPITCFKDLRKRMYPHQREGMKWLARLFGADKGGILGDDMGLGKTLQVIGYLSKMFEVNELEHVLIVLPNALVLPWQSEISRWAPSLNYALFHGKTLKSRVKLLHNLQRQGGILLTTYGLIVTNYEELSKGPDGREFVWDYVFLDEGHKIKNPTKTQKAAHYIPARHRIIVTGTPIQNNLMELWSLFDFVHHGSLLGTIKTFKNNYENPIIRARQKDASMLEKQLGYRMSQNLQKIIAPFFLRRTKAQLMADPNSGLPKLPRKNDIIVWVKMTEDQMKVYNSYLSLDEVKQLMHSSRSPLVALNILKKLCDHLRLLSVRICKALGMLTADETRKHGKDGVSHLDDPLEIPEWTRQAGAEEPINPNPMSSKPIRDTDTDCAATQLTGIPDSLLFKESAKLMVAIELLGYLSATGHKCLVFSQSTRMLDIMQQILTNQGYRFVRMDGKITKLEERAQIIRKFETNKDIPIFLLTTQVGGVGLNLTVADRIIIMDPSWNPAIDSQAVDRVYRIGQNKDVMIFRLITCGSVEEKIYIRQLFKLSINKQTTKESKDPFRYFTAQDLKTLFIVEDLEVSETQLQLTKMHSHKRVSDEVVDDQIKYLEAMESIFGVSDHDLVFSTEDADNEAKMSSEALETMVVRAESAIRGEINEESRANSKKMVPGIQERRQPSADALANEPAKSLSSPLFTMYDEEAAKVAIVLSDDEEPAPRRNNNNSDDVIILSESQSDANDNNNSEVIMESEDEQPPRDGRGSVFSAFNKSHGGKVKEEASEDTPTPIRNPTKAPNSRRQSLANQTLMRTIADSPQNSPPTKGGSKNVLVADSPDVLSKSAASSDASDHSDDNLSPKSSSSKFTVAESDYESDRSFEEGGVVMESQDEDEAEDRSSEVRTRSRAAVDDSQEFRSPAFRDVSVVVPNSSPRPGASHTKDQTASPISVDRCPESESENDEAPVASGMQSLTEKLHTTLSMDDSGAIKSVKRKQKRFAVMSSSESEPEVEGPPSFSGSPDGAENSAKEPHSFSGSPDGAENSAKEPHSFSGSPDGAENAVKTGNLSSDNNENSRNVHSSGKSIGSRSSVSRKNRKPARAILSDSSAEEDDKTASSPFSHSGNLSKRAQRPSMGKRKRVALLSSDDDSSTSGNSANESLVVMQELNVSINPSEPLLQCVKTPPAKVARSRLRELERSLLSPPQRDARSPLTKSSAKTEAGPKLKSSVDESDDDEEDDASSMEEEDDEDEEDSVEEKEDYDDSVQKDEEDSVEEEDEEEEEEDSDEEEESEYEDSEEEEDEDKEELPELPRPSSKKSDSYNQFINASREAYDDENYGKALKQALRALQQDSSDLKLQKYALWLRTNAKK